MNFKCLLTSWLLAVVFLLAPRSALASPGYTYAVIPYLDDSELAATRCSEVGLIYFSGAAVSGATNVPSFQEVNQRAAVTPYSVVATDAGRFRLCIRHEAAGNVVTFSFSAQMPPPPAVQVVLTYFIKDIVPPVLHMGLLNEDLEETTTIVKSPTGRTTAYIKTGCLDYQSPYFATRVDYYVNGVDATPRLTVACPALSPTVLKDFNLDEIRDGSLSSVPADYLMVVPIDLSEFVAGTTISLRGKARDGAQNRSPERVLAVTISDHPKPRSAFISPTDLDPLKMGSNFFYGECSEIGGLVYLSEPATATAYVSTCEDLVGGVEEKGIFSFVIPGSELPKDIDFDLVAQHTTIDGKYFSNSPPVPLHLTTPQVTTAALAIDSYPEKIFQIDSSVVVSGTCTGEYTDIRLDVRLDGDTYPNGYSTTEVWACSYGRFRFTSTAPDFQTMEVGNIVIRVSELIGAGLFSAEKTIVKGSSTKAVTFLNTPTGESGATDIDFEVGYNYAQTPVIMYTVVQGSVCPSPASGYTSYTSSFGSGSSEWLSTSINGLADGQVTICAVGSDGVLAGVLADVAQRSWIKDTVAPLATLPDGDVYLFHNLDDGFNPVFGGDYSLAVRQVPVGGDGVSDYVALLTATKADCDDGSNYDLFGSVKDGIYLDMTASYFPNGDYFLCVIGIDQAGNTQDPLDGFSFVNVHYDAYGLETLSIDQGTNYLGNGTTFFYESQTPSFGGSGDAVDRQLAALNFKFERLPLATTNLRFEVAFRVTGNMNAFTYKVTNFYGNCSSMNRYEDGVIGAEGHIEIASLTEFVYVCVCVDGCPLNSDVPPTRDRLKVVDLKNPMYNSGAALDLASLVSSDFVAYETFTVFESLFYQTGGGESPALLESLADWDLRQAELPVEIPPTTTTTPDDVINSKQILAVGTIPVTTVGNTPWTLEYDSFGKDGDGAIVAAIPELDVFPGNGGEIEVWSWMSTSNYGPRAVQLDGCSHEIEFKQDLADPIAGDYTVINICTVNEPEMVDLDRDLEDDHVQVNFSEAVSKIEYYGGRYSVNLANKFITLSTPDYGSCAEPGAAPNALWASDAWPVDQIFAARRFQHLTMLEDYAWVNSDNAGGGFYRIKKATRSVRGQMDHVAGFSSGHSDLVRKDFGCFGATSRNFFKTMFLNYQDSL